MPRVAHLLPLVLPLLVLGACGEEARLQVDAVQVTFGERALGESLSQELTLTWSGPDPVMVTARLEGPVTEAFEVDRSAVIVLPDTTTRIAVRYRADTPGEASARLVFTPEEATPVTVSVTGAALDLQAVVASALDLGQVWLGETRTALLWIANPTAAPRVVAWDAPVGALSFSLEAPPPGPLTLGPGATTPIAVVYAPTAPGIHEAELAFHWSGDAPPIQVRLTGQAARGVSPGAESLAFGPLAPGRMQAQTLTFSNESWRTTTLSLQVMDPSGDGSEWSLDGASIVSLPPWSQETVTVAFTPAAAIGASRVQLVWATDLPRTPYGTVALTGTRGGSWVPVGALDFGPVAVGASVTRGLVLENQGTAPATLQDWQLLLPPGLTVEGAPTDPLVLPAGDRHRVSITWMPQAEGTMVAEASLSSDDPLTPELRIPILGEAVPPTPCGLFLPQAFDLGTAVAGGRIGNSLPMTAASSNPGPCLISWAEVVAGEGHFQVGTGLEGPVLELPPGVTAQLSLSLNGPPADPAEGVLRLWVGDPEDPIRDVALTGWVQPQGLGFDRDTLDLGSVTPGDRTCPLPLCVVNASPEREVLPPSVGDAGFILTPAAENATGWDRCWLARFAPLDQSLAREVVWTAAEGSRAPPAQLRGRGYGPQSLLARYTVSSTPWRDLLVVAEDRVVGDYSGDWSPLAPYLITDQVAYRIGVTRASPMPSPAGPPGALLPYRPTGAKPVVVPSLTDPVGVLTDRLKISLAASERSFSDATRMALSPRNTAPLGLNDEFLRPGTVPLSILWLAAEATDGPGQGLEVLQATLRDLGRRGHPVQAINLVVWGTETTCASPLPPAGPLADIARATGGGVVRWCDEIDLQEVAERVFLDGAAGRTFPLPEPVASVTVTAQSPSDPSPRSLVRGVDWALEGTPASVVVSPLAWGTTVRPGDTLTVTYEPAPCP